LTTVQEKNITYLTDGKLAIKLYATEDTVVKRATLSQDMHFWHPTQTRYQILKNAKSLDEGLPLNRSSDISKQTIDLQRTISKDL